MFFKCPNIPCFVVILYQLLLSEQQNYSFHIFTVVNGGWNEYGEFSSCSEVCGGGKKTKVKHCDNPKPENGGANCSCPLDGSMSLKSCDGLKETIEESCNEDPCRGISCVCDVLCNNLYIGINLVECNAMKQSMLIT